MLSEVEWHARRPTLWDKSSAQQYFDQYNPDIETGVQNFIGHYASYGIMATSGIMYSILVKVTTFGFACIQNWYDSFWKWNFWSKTHIWTFSHVLYKPPFIGSNLKMCPFHNGNTWLWMLPPPLQSVKELVLPILWISAAAFFVSVKEKLSLHWPSAAYLQMPLNKMPAV